MGLAALFLAFLLTWAGLWASPALAGHNEPVACAAVPALTGNVTSSLGSCATTLATVPNGITLTDTLNKEFVVSTSTLSKTSDTTLATVPGLSIALTAGKTYSCRGHLVTTSTATGGLTASLVATNSLTATSLTFTGFIWNTPSLLGGVTNLTALPVGLGGGAAVISDYFFEGSIVVNVAGTLNVQAAQSASFATESSVLQG